MSPTEEFSERDEIEMLLPWFVTGRLDAAERARVEAFLVKEPAMRRQLDLIRDEQSASISVADAMPMPRTLSVASGMAYIADRSPALRAHRARAGIIEQMRDFFVMPTARAVRLATIAAVAVFAIQAISIAALWRTSETGPDLAGGSGRAVGDDTIANVRFKDGATLSAVGEVLTGIGARIIEGPRADGWFTVRLGGKALSDEEKASKISALRRRADVVQLVIVPPQK